MLGPYHNMNAQGGRPQLQDTWVRAPKKDYHTTVSIVIDELLVNKDNCAVPICKASVAHFAFNNGAE